MEFSLTSEQKLIQENITGFARMTLNAGVIERDRERIFDRNLWKKCADQKLTGLPVDESFGGAGLDPVSCIAALEALGYGSDDGGLNFSICAHLLACIVPVMKYGSAEQRKKYLPGLCDGSLVAINAMTENEAGSDVFAVRTSAQKVEGGFKVNGTKAFCTNGPGGDLILVYAVTDESKGFFGGITAFLVNKSSQGVGVGQQYEKMGLRTSGISELVFNDAFIPDEDVLGGIGGGASIFNYSMEWERIGIAACHVGTMRKLLEKTIDYTLNRKNGDEPIGKKQAIAHRVADMKVRLEASGLLTYKAAAGIDKDRSNMIHASAAKLFVSEAFVKSAMDTMQVFGGNGYMTEYGIERIVRDALGSTIYSGTSDVQRNIISKFLGL
ncbi:MAG TPA: acyl-CoA dehydrogenase family protein [Bacteroidia bacterium]|jgi:hypothetical protein